MWTEISNMKSLPIHVAMAPVFDLSSSTRLSIMPKIQHENCRFKLCELISAHTNNTWCHAYKLCKKTPEYNYHCKYNYHCVTIIADFRLYYKTKTSTCKHVAGLVVKRCTCKWSQRTFIVYSWWTTVNCQEYRGNSLLTELLLLCTYNNIIYIIYSVQIAPSTQIGRYRK